MGRFIKKMKKLLFVVFAGCILGLGLSFLGCSRTDGDNSAKESTGPIVIQIDDQKIDASILEKYLESRPLHMNAENTGDLLRKKVDELVVEELMLREALRLKLDQAPDTRQRIREILNSKLSAELIHKTVMQREVAQSELQAYYEAHQDEFNRPAEVRLGDILIAVPKEASGDQRAQLKQKAENVLAEALASPNQREEFAQLVQKYSDPPEKYAKGDTGFFSMEGKPIGMDPRIVEAAFNLENSGDVATAVIEAEDGYHILLLNGKRPAFSRPFEQVARDLERRIKTEEFKKRRDEFVGELKAKAKIVIDEKAVAQVQEKVKTERKMPPLPPANRNLAPGMGDGTQMPPEMGGGKRRPPAMRNNGIQMPPMPPRPEGNMDDQATGKAMPFVEPKAKGD